jgi:hypothetical protein
MQALKGAKKRFLYKVIQIGARMTQPGTETLNIVVRFSNESLKRPVITVLS